MSRIGRSPVTVPSNVTVQVDKDNRITVKGPKGQLVEKIDADLTVTQEDGHLTIVRPTDQRHHRAQHGLARALVANMVTGVTQGFSKRLEIHGVGYRAELRGNNLVLQVGKSHPVEFQPPSAEMAFQVDKEGRNVVISGIDKSMVGELAAVIRKTRPPEPYKGKGIRYAGETVRLKAGKTGKTGKK